MPMAGDCSMLEYKDQRIYALILISVCAVPSVFAATGAEVLRGLAAYRAGEIDRAVQILTAAAELGDSDARFSLGAIYLEGQGVRPDPGLSTRWYRAAAEQGHIEAQFSLGNAYRHGRGVAVDFVEARRWWMRAGRAGSAKACLNLGVDYLQQSDSLARAELGVAWLRRSAELGSDRAGEYLTMLREPGNTQSAGRDWSREPLRSEAQLLVVDPLRFTLQLFSASSRELAEAFIDRNAIGAQALLFRLPKNKRLLWNVVYGDYESRKEVVQTIAGMRHELRRTHPWPRALSEVQDLVASVWSEREQVSRDLLP